MTYRRHIAGLLARAQRLLRPFGFSIVPWARLRQKVESGRVPGGLRHRMRVLPKLAARQSKTQDKRYVHLMAREGLTTLKWAGGVVIKLFTFVLLITSGYRRWLRQNLSLFLLLVPALLYLPAVLWFQLPNQYAVVMSGSMEPAYSAGDLVILRPVKDIQVGDVVAFETPRGTPGFPPRLLHRVVEYDREGARLITKGDANPDTDPFKVGLESVLGKATGFKVPSGGYVIQFLQSRYGKIWIAIVALGFAYPTIVRMGAWTRRSAQRAVTETIGLEAGRLDRVESGVDETREALVQFSRAIAEYATHLQSHTAAVQGMSEGSQGLVAAVQAQNEVLVQLKEILDNGKLTQRERPPIGQASVPRRRPARKFPPGHRGGSR